MINLVQLTDECLELHHVNTMCVKMTLSKEL